MSYPINGFRFWKLWNKMSAEEKYLLTASICEIDFKFLLSCGQPKVFVYVLRTLCDRGELI